jgi:hypothetical protein
MLNGIGSALGGPPNKFVDPVSFFSKRRPAFGTLSIFSSFTLGASD